MAANGTPLYRDSDFLAAEREWLSGRYRASPPEVGMLFRVEAVSYSYVTNEWGDYASTAPRLELFGYEVERFTPHGATLKHVWSGSRQRWVDLRANAKQWASRTAREAVEQFRRRREGQIHILRRQLRRAEDERRIAEIALGMKGKNLAPC